MKTKTRTIDRLFFADRPLYAGECDTGLSLRIVLMSLWTVCDREGRFAWQPFELKAACLPLDSVDFSAALDALASRGFVAKYRVEGIDYGQVANWHESQHVNGREAASVLPPPPAALVNDTRHAINTSVPKQTAPETTPEPGAPYDLAWDQIRAELMDRLGRAQLSDNDELELRVWRLRGFDPVICLKAIRKHFDEQGRVATLDEVSLPLCHAHRAAGRSYMGRAEALALAMGRTTPQHRSSQLSPSR